MFCFARIRRWYAGWVLMPLMSACGWISPAAAAAGETVAVGLASGRVFVGEVDPRTDDEQLWLRAEGPGITICRPIRWDRILVARHGDEELSAEELRAEADTLISAPAENMAPADSDSLPPPPEPQQQDPSVGAGAPQIETLPPPRLWIPDTRVANYIQAARARDLQVCSISIDAGVANWNQTVETDGIVLHLYPLDGLGFVVPVDGTLDVDLIAAVPAGAPLGVPLPQIGRWTVRVTPDQFGPTGAVFKLPFQGAHPEFDLNIGPLGLVHARLNVPGNGSFETSQAMVRIRQYSAVRDEAQQINGRRFFDVERVDRFGR